MTELVTGGHDLPVETMRFGPLTIAFDARVLRPRPWTTAQSLWAAELLDEVPDGDVLELCTGAGHIGLLAVAESSRRLVAVDADVTAAAYAAANAAAAGMGDRVEVRLGLLEKVVADHERFPMIVADPPWVASDDTSRYPEDPLLAIDGGDDGLHVARLCLRTIATHLAPHGVSIIQLGTADQARDVDRWLTEASDLRVSEVRTHERGVLARVERVART